MDSDGRPNGIDNCINVPNYLDQGTCTRGRKFYPCNTHSDCGCDGFCSRWQEDCDGDGIGNACDECMVISGGCKSGPCPYENQSFTDIVPAHRLVGPEATAQMSNEDRGIFWFVLSNLWWTGHNYTAYPSTLQFFKGIVNGPDRLCDECVHDYNENGICDEEEEGGLPLSISNIQLLEALQEKYVYCKEKIANCTEEDREADPFGCMW